MTTPREVSAAYRPGKRAKKVLQPRAARHTGHPHELSGGADLHRHPMPDRGATRAPKASKVTSGHSAMVERNLGILAEVDPTLVRGEVEIFKDNLVVADAAANVAPAKRAQWAALETHREMASTILGAGGTFDEAADWAGVARSTVVKWYEESEFRRRVEEQRALVRNKIAGRIEAWMDRRTADPATLDAADPKITLAIHDRVAGPAGGRAAQQPAVVINANILTYPELMERAARAALQPPPAAEVDVVDGAGESRGFPLLGPGGLPVAGRGAQSD